jgi:hypothetical protein
MKRSTIENGALIARSLRLLKEELPVLASVPSDEVWCLLTTSRTYLV